MLILASLVLLILKVTVFPAIAWWIVALPIAIIVGFWLLSVVVVGLGALFIAKFLG